METPYECIGSECIFFHYCNKEDGCILECSDYYECVKDEEKIVSLVNLIIEKYPEEMVERAIKGMLPHGRLGRQMGKKLFVYAGSEQAEADQDPCGSQLLYTGRDPSDPFLSRKYPA